MDSTMYYYIASGFLLLLLPVVFIGSYWLKGFFWKYVKVRGSQGRLLLMRIKTKTADQYAVAEIIDGAVKFRDRKGQGHTVPFPKDEPAETLISYSLGVRWLEFDEEKDCFFRRDGSGVSSNDGELTDSLILRALMKPNPKDILVIIILIVAVVTLLVALADLGMIIQLKKQVAELALNSMKGTILPGVQ